jgi:anaphase-promoting complex subunit 5
LACVTFARCTIAAGGKSSESLGEAVQYLQIAEADYANIECWRSLADVQYMLSVIYNNLGMEKDRNEAAARNLQTQGQAANDAALYCEEWVSDVWRLSCDVGVALAKR